MSSYRCVLLLLVAWIAAVCMDGGEAVTFRQIVNVGDSYTFNCDAPFRRTYQYYWYRSGTPGYFISLLTYTSIGYVDNFKDRERVLSYFYPSVGHFSLVVDNVNFADSADYACKSYDYSGNYIEDRVQYVIYVFDCLCTVAQQHMVTSATKNVTCFLDSNPVPLFNSQGIDIYTDTITNQGHIQGNELTFSTNDDLLENLTITFNPFTTVEGSISCVVPAAPIITTTTHRTTPPIPTSVTSSTDHTSTPPSTGYPSSSNYVSRTPSASGSTISHLMAPGEQNKKSQRTLIIAISAVGSALILLLIIVIILLRLRKRQEHAPNAAYHSQNGTKEEKGEIEETDMCYTSIQDTPPEHLGGSRNAEIKAPAGGRDSKKDLTGSGFDNDGMVDNILYDFTSDYRASRAIADPSTVDACGPLYTMPDKTSKSADRASVMSKRDLSDGQEAMHPSLASRGRGDVTPSQNGATRCEDRARDDDGGVVDMYGVPDKGPGSRKAAVTHSFAEAADGTGASASYVNVNLSFNTTQPEPGDIAALYAVVDKREKN